MKRHSSKTRSEPIGATSRKWCLLAAALATTALAGPALATPMLSLIYTFSGGSDGSIPQGAPLLDRSGALFGDTAQGGASGDGVVFELTPPRNGGSWTQSVLHSFSGADGADPDGGLMELSGNLFGVTTSGGASGQGTAFELTHTGGAWTESVLHSFSGSDGANPAVRLVAGAKGTLYGIAPSGGVCNQGVAFQLTPPSVKGGAWTETVLHSFEGSPPFGVLLIDKNGALYGTTENTSQGAEVAFKLTPPAQQGGAWNFQVLHTDKATFLTVDFLDAKGNIFGTTLGPNQLFELAPSGTEKILIKQIDYSMPGLAQGPGGTWFGGSFGANVFKFTPPAGKGGGWTFEDLTVGSCYDHGMPAVDPRGTIYGYDVNVCQAPPHGAVFQLIP